MKLTAVGAMPFKTLFLWDHRKQRLLIWIVLATLLHLLLFFIIDIRYAAPMDRVPSRTPVWMPVEGSPEADRIHAWAESRDPTLLSPTRLPLRDQPLPVIRLYQPSYDQDILPLVPYPDSVIPPLPKIPVIAGIDLWQPAALPSSTSKAPATTLPTKIQWKGFLGTRKLQEVPPLNFTVPPHDHLTPTRFRLGVAPDGVPIFLFLLEGSGDTSLDSFAAQYLKKIRFEPAEDITWGDILLLWGVDTKEISQ